MSQDPQHVFSNGVQRTIDPQIATQTRLGTPPMNGRSLLSAQDDGNIIPHFSILLHPQADLESFQQTIDSPAPKSPTSPQTGSPSSSPSPPSPQQPQSQMQLQPGQLISQASFPVPNPSEVGKTLYPNESQFPTLSSEGPALPPSISLSQPRIKDKSFSNISPATLQAARQQQQQQQQQTTSSPQAVAAALNRNLEQTEEQRRQENIYHNTVSIRGICKAQSLVRGYLARTRARKQLMLQAWHELDTKEENELSKNSLEYSQLRTLVDLDTAKQAQEQLNSQVGGLQNSPSGSRSPKTAVDDGVLPRSAQNSPLSPGSTMQTPSGSRLHASQSPSASAAGNAQDNAVLTPLPPPAAPSIVMPNTPAGHQSSPPSSTKTASSTPHEIEIDPHAMVGADGIPDQIDRLPQQPLRPALSITSSRGRVENGLYRPASGLSFADDDGVLSLTDLHIPQSATIHQQKSVFGDDDDPTSADWVEKAQTRMKQLRVLREFREHAVPHPSTTGKGTKNAKQEDKSIPPPNDILIDWAAIDNITTDNEHFYKQAPHFRTRLGSYKVASSIVEKYPRANLPLLTSQNPIDIQWVHLLRDELASGRIPIAPIVERLILICFSILCKEPNVQDVFVPSNGKVTVVGDIHGQLPDLLSIFRLNGTPSGSNVYIFNGDWVDRGSQSIEVLLLLMSWKALYPKFVYLNRGNHEAADINSRDGFEKECKDKYGIGLFPLFSELFTAVPIACRIFGQAPEIQAASNHPQAPQKPAIFVTHGGIPHKGLTIDQIQRENRFHAIPPPNSILFNMLWSDPSPYKGSYPSSRGAGYEFGPDVTLDFLRNNRCCMLIRSHECVEAGWELTHHNMCVTVFSCSNYVGVIGNQGAYCIIESTLRPTLVTFYAEPQTQLATRSSIRFKRLESAVIRKLMDRIAIHRLDLISHFQQISKSNLEKAKRGEPMDILNTNAAIPCSDQVISRQQWADGLRAVLGLNIPFLLFQEQLGLPDRGVLGDERGPINFMAFLAPFTPKNDLFSQLESYTQQATEDHIIRINSGLGSASSGNFGTLSSLGDLSSIAQSSSALDGLQSSESFHSRPFSQQIASGTNQMGTVTDGALNTPNIQVEYDLNGNPILSPQLSRLALTQLSQLLYSHRYEVESVFRFLDLDNNGSVTRDEFVTGIYNLIVLFRAKVSRMRNEMHPDCETYASNASLLLDFAWDKDSLRQLAEIVDQNGDDEIQYSEFMNHFKYEAENNVNEVSIAASLVHNSLSVNPSKQYSPRSPKKD